MALRSQDKLLMVLLFILAVVLRGTYAWYNRDQLLDPDRCGPQRTLAKAIAAGEGFQGRPPVAPPNFRQMPTAFWEPVYPLVLAALEYLDAEHAGAWRVGLGAVLGGLAAVVFYLLAFTVFESTAVAGLTGLLVAASYLLVLYSGLESDATLVCVELGLFLLLVMRMADRPRLATGLGIGVVAALVVQTRVETGPLVVIATLWLMWRLRGQGGFVSAVGIWLVFLAGLVPWTLRNWLVAWPCHPMGADDRPIYQRVHFDRANYFVPIVARVGHDLWLGNSDAATGSAIARDGARGAEWQSSLVWPDSNQDLYYSHILPEPFRDYWLGYLAVRWIVKHPDRWLELRLKTFVYFWTTYNLWLPRELERLRIEENRLTPVALVLMLATALVGMRWSHRWRRRTGLLTVALVTYPLMYVLGNTSQWHDARIPLDGVLLIYSAFFMACFAPSVSAPLRAGIGRREPPALLAP